MIREVFKGFRPERRIARHSGLGVWGLRLTLLVAGGAFLYNGEEAPAGPPPQQEVTLHCEEIPKHKTRALPFGEEVLKLSVDGEQFGPAHIGLYRTQDDTVLQYGKNKEYEEAHSQLTVVMEGRVKVANVVTAPDSKAGKARLNVSCQLTGKAAGDSA